MNTNKQYKALENLLIEHFDIMKWIISNKHNKSKGFQFMMLNKYFEILLKKASKLFGGTTREDLQKAIDSLLS